MTLDAGDRGDQRHRLRPDLRASHPHRHRVEEVARAVRAGNVYVNRNQIGAVVGSQPFGGRACRDGAEGGRTGLCPALLPRAVGRGVGCFGRAGFRPNPRRPDRNASSRRFRRPHAEPPGPTGESNRYTCVPRGPILCLGPGPLDAALEQGRAGARVGCPALAIAPGLSGAEGLDGTSKPDALTAVPDIAGVAYWGGPRYRPGAPPGAGRPRRSDPAAHHRGRPRPFCVTERHLCIDTTAFGRQRLAPRAA
jgi:RHH-type proline utilization regulon transcriptional repressor/proline dehydrogenase/delta 1-pyrroline-5-carboxylate dehydrogenase